jgi:acetate kinase
MHSNYRLCVDTDSPKAEDILNVQSGWRAITGTSDFSQIATPDAEGPHRLAFDMFVHNITGYVGSYFVKLDGKVDALVFSGGIGESSGYLRAEVIKRLQCLGFGPTLENHDGDTGSLVREIGSGGIKVLVCRTDEEAQMAQNVFEILHKTSA